MPHSTGDGMGGYGGFGGLGIGNPGSYGGQQSVGAPGFDGYDNVEYAERQTAVTKNTFQQIAGGLLAALGVVVPGGSPMIAVGGRMFMNAREAKPALDKALAEYEKAHPEMKSRIEGLKRSAQQMAQQDSPLGGGDGGMGDMSAAIANITPKTTEALNTLQRFKYQPRSAYTPRQAFVGRSFVK